MKLMHRLIFLLCLSCSGKHNSATVIEGGLGKTCESNECTPTVVTTAIEPHYESLRKEILLNQCLGCHDSSGIFSSLDFSTYEATLSHVRLFTIPDDGSESRFVQSLVTGKMPKGAKALPQEQIDIIRQWVALGMPEKAIAATDCDLIDFETVNTQVFQVSCTRCHDFTSEVNLESYENIKSHLSDVKWMIETDKMPPRKPLEPESKELVLKWIEQGAPETVSLPEACIPK